MVNSLQPKFFQWCRLGAIALGAAGAVVALQLTGGLQLLEWVVLDHWFRLRPPEARKSPVVLVTIDEADINQLGRWPISDDTLATLIERLRQHRPVVIGLDLYRDLPVEPGNAKLRQVFASTPNLVGIEKAVANRQGAVVAPPPVLRDRDQVAVNDLVLDTDGKIRRSLLSIRQQHQIKLALGTKVALAYLNSRQITPETIDANRNLIRLGKVQFQPLPNNAGGYVQSDVGGYQILSNFIRFADSIPQVSITDVLADRVSPTLIQDQIVLIGSTAVSLQGDRFYTPYTTDIGNTWSGIELHANLASQIISGAMDGRSPLQGIPEPLEWLWILLWATVGTAFGWRVKSGKWAAISIPVILGGLFASSYSLFLLGWWAIAIAPLLALTGAGLTSRGYWVWKTLTEMNQTLERKVQERTEELQDKNAALEQAKIDAEAANRAKSMFLASMSHELRTPLTAILGFGELLSHSASLDPEDQEYVTIINRSGEHLLNLIDDVLELAKIEAGAVSLNLVSTNLASLLDGVRNMFYLKAAAKNLTLHTDFAPDLPQWVQLDEGKLRQVLINLLGNAVKFTDRGSITLRVNQQAIEPENGASPVHHPANHQWGESNLAAAPQSQFLRFEVEDTGIGIASHEVNQLFQPFVQTESGRKLQKGTGLGLAICRQFVQLMGGNTSVQSSLGQGSIFAFEIPVLPAPEDKPISQKAQRVWRLAPNQAEYRALVVEDYIDNRRLLVELLSEAGFAVRSAADGSTAIAEWQQWHPHLILLDIQIPDLDGYEVTRQIRAAETHPQPAIESAAALPASSTLLLASCTVILALTADGFKQHQEAILAAGCDDVIWKPFQEVTLFSKIAEHLEVKFEDKGI
jgi:CHASE2 domain-containing sensor protein/CheY-like chemotaxis protein/nitrogen-specific signal transduction histidine kinase